MVKLATPTNAPPDSGAGSRASWYGQIVILKANLILLSVLLSGLWTPAALASEAPLRRVLWVQGEVKAKSLTNRSAANLPLQATDSLTGKFRVKLSGTSSLWFLSSGKELIGLKGDGVWDLQPGSPPLGEGTYTRIALGPAALAAAPHVAWIESANALKPESALLALSPVESAISTQRPVLRWRNESESVRVSLTLMTRSPDGRAYPVEVWRGLSGTHHEVQRPLQEGKDYAWRVSTDKDPSLTLAEDEFAWFRVLSAEAIQAFRRADAHLARLQLDNPDAADALEVIRALTWEHYGLAQQARKAWASIADKAGDIEGINLYRARLALRVLARPRAVTAPVESSPPKRP